MKCADARKLLVIYLGPNPSASQRTLVQAHLASCAACQRELDALLDLQTRISHYYQDSAARAIPPADSWPRLKAQLAGTTSLSPMQSRLALLRGKIRNRAFALAVASLVLIAIMALAFVPSLLAQVNELYQPMYVFEAPGGNGFAATASWPGFQPYNPTYLPSGRWQFSSGGRDDSGIRYLVLWYVRDAQFVVISQSKAQPGKYPPIGQAILVSGQPATLIRGLRGVIEPAKITYADGKQISWIVGDTKIDLLSDLSDQEMLRVAESLRPADRRDIKLLPQLDGPAAPYPLNAPRAP